MTVLERDFLKGGGVGYYADMETSTLAPIALTQVLKALPCFVRAKQLIFIPWFIELGTLQLHKWENCFTIDKKSWGFRRNAALSDYYSTPELLKEMVKTISCGGNMLLNVGITHLTKK